MRRQTRGWLTALLTTAVVATGAGAASAGTPAETTVPAAPAETTVPAQTPKPPKPPKFPTAVDGGAWKSGHIQGMAVDRRKGFVYFSFTNLLVKTDLTGKPLGSVTGFTGHLGDLDFNTKDGRVYGSLEYKAAKAFYIAIFDGDRITEMDMDAETTGVVSTVHLQEVVDDYTADMDGNGVFDGNTGNTPDHRYGCSGIDGVAFGPAFDDKHGGDRRGTSRTQLLTVAYGVYANTTRQDNDNQVLLQYDIRRWKKYERPLTEADPHTSGPGSPDGKYFSYTGNTTYGVQNLDYDAHTGNWLLAAYKGTKTQFPNYSLFVIDGSKHPVSGPVMRPADARARTPAAAPEARAAPPGVGDVRLGVDRPVRAGVARRRALLPRRGGHGRGGRGHQADGQGGAEPLDGRCADPLHADHHRHRRRPDRPRALGLRRARAASRSPRSDRSHRPPALTR